jgi:glycosyltransferase involved in cell wall biosynthesis
MHPLVLSVAAEVNYPTSGGGVRGYTEQPEPVPAQLAVDREVPFRKLHLGVPAMISVIIPVYNSGRFLERTIAGLASQDYARTRYEVIMVDNNSSDDSVEIIRRHPWITLLREPKQGAYSARNRGFHQALGEILAFTDADCVPRSDWLSTIGAAMAKPGVGIVLGRRLAGYRRGGLRLLDEYQDIKENYIFNGSDGDLYYGYTNNMAVRRGLLASGGFKEKMRGSDTAFVSQVVKKFTDSCVHYHREMQVTHLELDSIHIMFKKYFIYGRSQELMDHETNWRALTVRERLRVFGRTVALHRLSHWRAAYLLCLLSLGACCWWAGILSAKIVR